MSADDEGDDELEVRRGLHVNVTGTLYEPGQSPRQIDGHDPRIRALLAHLLLSDDAFRARIEALAEGFDEDLAELARVVGVFAEPGAPPWPPIEPPRFELRDESLAQCEPIATTGALVKNPRLFVQAGAEPPPELADRVFLGRALWARLEAEPGNLLVQMSRELPRELSTARPIVWVEHPRSRVLQPFWTMGDHGDALRAVAIEGRSPDDLPARAREALVAAGVLVPADAGFDRAAWVRGLRDDLARRRVAVLGPIVSPLFAAELKRWARDVYERGVMIPDPFGELREGTYCELTTMFMQHQLAPFIDELTPEPSEPTYTWLTRYQGGARLKPHTDRPQCRWNVSFDLGRERPVAGGPRWAFSIEHAGQVQDVVLGAGEAVLYSGTESRHWREMLAEAEGAYFGLMHFVDRTFVGRRS